MAALRGGVESPAPSREARHLVILVAVKALVGLAVLAAGFVAVSDDDFARVVIAQQFAVAPSLDPSGTSWLPAPFWIYGAALAAFGRSLLIARVTAWLLGILSVVLVYRAARFLDVAPGGAFAGALIASVIPHSAWLAVAPVPEAPVAALVVIGLASLATSVPGRLVTGGAALLVATLSRYEAWPVALVFAICCVYKSFTTRRQRLPSLLAAILAVTGMIAWIAHGAARHGDPLFFVHRVAEYQQALGGGPSILRAFARYPAALLFAEPELVALTALAWLASRGMPASTTRYRYPIFGCAALLAFVIVGAVRGSSATHHFERSLLPLWFVMAIFAGERLVSIGRAPMEAWRHPRARLVVMAALFLAAAARFRYPRDSFADRANEMDIGRTARTEVPPNERLLVDTPDFGFFAVIAAFGRPEHAEALRDHDPRQRDPQPDDPSAMLDRARAFGARFVVLRPEDAARIGAKTSRVAQSDGLALVRLE